MSDIAILVDALQRIAGGGCVIDPATVQRLLDQAWPSSAAAELTSRERDVLTLMAE